MAKVGFWGPPSKVSGEMWTLGYVLGKLSLLGIQVAQGIPSPCIWRLGFSGRPQGAQEGMLMTGL